MVNPRDYLDKAQALAAQLPSEPSIKLHREQCSCLQHKLEKALKLVVGRVASYNRVPIPVQYEKVLEEFHHLVLKVKTFVEDCCYEDENDFVLGAIRVIAHRGRFFQYHVELDWCSFLVKCLWQADKKHRKPVYCQTLQKFDWEQKFKSLLYNSGETSNMIAADEAELKARLESWIAIPGEHQAICWALLRRFGSKTDSELHNLPGNLGFPPIPTTHGKFIGAGSYGHVQEIKWKEKLFAVKYFPINNVETINSEVKILEDCCHPHIVNLILAHKEDTTQYLMMERLSWDLQSYIDERKKRGTFPFPTSEVVDMISQICEGMLYLNDPGRKVSHRDLKPRNILVKELKPVTDSEIPAVELQVADFGMAKERKEKGPGKSSVSENTPNCGTLLYRAPEMTGKPGGVNIRASSMKADMYSFAVTCSFILTGTAPFRGYENRESLKQGIKDGIRPHLPDNYPPALATLLRRCWDSDPNERPESFNEILTELRKLKANFLTGAIEGVEPVRIRVPEPPQPEPVVTFNPGDRRLNILVLGNPEAGEALIGHLCGAGRRQTVVEGHVNLTESRNSSPPMCLYNVNRNDDDPNIRAFVKVRNQKWRQRKVEALWVNDVHSSDARNWSALFPDSTSRLHMVWFACRKLSDLPNFLEWPEITKRLCDLPVQILVVEDQSLTQDLDTATNVEQEFNIILKNGSKYFPKAHESMEKLIVKVDLQADDLKGELWRKCWAVKTPVEIGNAAKIIREIRKQLGPAGKCVQTGVGGARVRKEVTLSRSGEFVLHFLCAYWDIPQESLRRVLQGPRTAFILQARGNVKIKPCKFVEFCLIVAAIILHNARDNAGNAKYVCSWTVSSESSLHQLQGEARECYNSYFASATSQSSLYYDTMVFEDIRLFLESIFERKAWDPRPVESVDTRDSCISGFMKRICTRGKSVSPGMTPRKFE